MSNMQISERYARALFALAQDAKGGDEVCAAMQDIGRIIRQLPEFREFLGNPLLSFEERSSVLTAVFKGKVPDLVMKFLLFVCFKNRLQLLPGMTEALEELYLKAHGRVRALVQTALGLDEEQKKQIVRQLKEKYTKEVATDWQVRQDMLGGIRIFIEGKLHDYSFTSQLEQFRQKALS